MVKDMEEALEKIKKAQALVKEASTQIGADREKAKKKLTE